MFKSHLVAGLIGMTLVACFLGIICAWIKEPALIVIVVGVMGMMVYDFWLSIREIRDNGSA